MPKKTPRRPYRADAEEKTENRLSENTGVFSDFLHLFKLIEDYKRSSYETFKISFISLISSRYI